MIKNNAGFLILAAAMILSACIYVLGTRYQHCAGMTLYDRMTGNLVFPEQPKPFRYQP